jgi:hypothetical protein
VKVIKNDYPGAIFQAIPMAEPGEPCPQCGTPVEEVQGLFGILACPACESWLFEAGEPRRRRECGDCEHYSDGQCWRYKIGVAKGLGFGCDDWAEWTWGDDQGDWMEDKE